KTRFINVSVPVDSLMPMLPTCEDLSMSVVSKRNDMLGLLLGYVDLLKTWQKAASKDFGGTAAGHVRDLMVAMAETTRDMPAVPERTGIRAARLEAIKSDIELQLCEPGLSIQWIATLNHISLRYIRKLFQDEGTTFSDYVLARRLERTYHLLLHQRPTDTSISAIAYACGFGDLSYFNRTFRRRFGMTPTGVRSGMLDVSE
ncbi:MAG TPA: helix-turn-helix transcriptional regulator, partial [Devosia sp.]|nr:helix-turn-helix transcriptional regulator [Devosia sp.]